MWIRQEYMPEKARYEAPYEIDIERPHKCDKIRITLAQSPAAIGTTVWDGSIALAKMFDTNPEYPPERLRESSVLELGAGCGLVGIYLCLLGARTTVLTDLKCCVSNLENNIDLNVPKGQQYDINALEYTWGTDTSKLTRHGLYDLVVAAEVLYDEKDSVVLAKSIARVVHSKSKVFVSMGRNRLGEKAFVLEMIKQGFNVSEVSRDNLHPKFQDSIIKVIMFEKE
ncbi:protein N-lysine methyltransferase METTL21A [Nematostella vectensis]|uniref:protein N-lysine methyltransferase METTL21A n=1 Tax=Nematostella vectensis TaxID=45351 RepID=UPI00138FE3A2|nr:protein N-lysine methyltransferase METTL21A [Nematostella vectensis]